VEPIYRLHSLVGTDHVWNFKLAANRERPRFAFIGFDDSHYKQFKKYKGLLKL